MPLPPDSTMLGLFPIYYKRLFAWFVRQTPPSGVRRVASFSAAVSTDVGVVRQENQDRAAIARGCDFGGRTYLLAALSDGIGGMNKGAECASITLAGFFTAFFEEALTDADPEKWLLRAAQKSNDTVYSKLSGTGGATLAAILLRSDGAAYWVNVGDSRVYHVSGARLSQLSIDDTIAGQLGDAVNPNMGQLLQFIGMGKFLEPHVSKFAPGMQDSVLLTSDGVHFLDVALLEKIVGHSSDSGVCVRRLTELTKWCGGDDNASAVMISLSGALEDSGQSGEAGYEIWDPFGELQICAEAAVRQAPLMPASRADKLNAEAVVNQGKSPIKQLRVRQHKKKDSRAKMKGAQEVLIENDAGEAPQLVIEYHKKNI